MTNPTNRPLSLFPAPMLEPDHYAQVTPDMLPPLADLSDEDMHAMAMQYADEQSDEGESIADTRDHDDEGEPFDDEGEDYSDDFDTMTDAEADADTLRMAGMGTDEDYGGMIGGDSDLMGEW